MPDELEERLKSHARSFDSLLSLIPAKLYYGEDVSDQWKRKKQTPEQKRAAKRAKLDPDNWKSAKDVMDERAAEALKRKREDDEDLSDEQLVEPEKPKSKQDLENPKAKKRKTEPENTVSSNDQKAPSHDDLEDKRRRKSEQRAAKKQRKAEKKAKAQEKIDRQKARKKDASVVKPSTTLVVKKFDGVNDDKDEDEADEDEIAEAIDLSSKPAVVLTTTIPDDGSISSPSEDESSVFSPQPESGTSSISSIQHVIADTPVDIPPKPQNDHTTTSTMPANPPNDQPNPRERLQAAISAFRAERKADTPTGPKNRQELLQQRRQQEERRRAEKKEQKRREKEEQARLQDEEIAKRFSPGGSGSLLASPRSPLVEQPDQPNNFSFGRIAFDDGTNFDPSTSDLSQAHKKRGPSDPATALKAAQNKNSRLSGLDPGKRSLIEQKDMWLNARKRASGEKVKDDTSLLKKALKRHDGQKRKSEKEWTERQEGVKKSIDMKQRKRMENLAKRKEEKKHGKGGKGKKIKRPGFEGSFRGRTGGGKRK